MRATAAAHRLMLDGAMALAKSESYGIRIDTRRLKASFEQCDTQVAAIEAGLKEGEVWRLMRRTFGKKANIGSNVQIADVVFRQMGHHCAKMTATGRYATDADTLAEVDSDWIRDWGTRAKILKVANTYLKGIKRETVLHEDYITKRMMYLLHCVFNLHTTDTYRSSASQPNFQNMPIRDEVLSRPIRECIIPRPGHRLVEVDFSGAEVRVAACYHKDPRMLAYLSSGADWHKEVAADCFLLPLDRVSKKLRQAAKGTFTFAEFYGDYFLSVARNLWDEARRDRLMTSDNVLVLDHLKTQGITCLGEHPPDASRDQEPPRGTFQRHVWEMEKRLWKERFPVYDEWRKETYARYKARGYFGTKTGFYVEAAMRRNAVINSPVQGSSFHCLLWAFNRLHKIFEERGLRAYIIGQIHDSIVMDVHDDDVQEALAIAKEVIEVDLPRHFKWLITGMTAEAKVSEVAERGGNWFGMKEMAL